MSPQTLVDDVPEARRAPQQSERPRLTVREMQVALDAARALAYTSPAAAPSTPAAAAPAEERDDADRSRAAPRHDDALEGDSSVTAPIVASAVVDAAPTPDTSERNQTPTADYPSSAPEPWVPDHDGPVSLTAATAPRIRAARRATARPDKPARQASTNRPARPAKNTTVSAETADLVRATRPLILVRGASGGSGATTAAVLLAASLARMPGAVLVACETPRHRGDAAARAGADGGDMRDLTRWIQRPTGPVTNQTPGLAIAGQDAFLVAAASRDARAGELAPADGDRFTALARASTTAAVLVDWSADQLPTIAPGTNVRLVVVAAATAPGLLAAEHTVQSLQEEPSLLGALTTLVTVDVRGRGARRAGRAARARLHALDVPIAAIPFDPALADNTEVHWPALRPRTRSAVLASLTQLLHRKETR